MAIIYTDILKHWTACWWEAVLSGIILVIIGRLINQKYNRKNISCKLLFADGVFLCFFVYVTLVSRSVGSRREVQFLPFASFDICSEDFHYVVENVLFFIPFGILLYMTMHAYGKKCSGKTILVASLLSSISVELLQYAFACGKSETDDVIANAAGAMIGYMLVKRSSFD